MRAYARDGRRGRGALGDHRTGPRPRLRAISRPGDGPSAACALAELEARGYPEELIDAVAGHAEFLGVPRDDAARKDAVRRRRAVGLRRRLRAGAPHRDRGDDAEVGAARSSSSPRSRPRSTAIRSAAGVEELGVDSTEHIQFVIEAMAERADELGLAPAPKRLRETRLRRGRGQAVAHDLLRPMDVKRRIHGRRLLPAAARLRPLEQVVHGAEAVRHAVLAAVADEPHDGPRRAPGRSASS